MESENRIVNVNEYTLQASVDDYEAAISALTRRTETDGHPGVERYWWYADGDAGTAAAVIVYADADAWLAHHRMAYEWPEMGALQTSVSLSRLTVFGPLSPEVEEWLAGAGLSFTHYPQWAAGFARDPS